MFENLYHRKNIVWVRLEGTQKRLVQAPNRFLTKLEAQLKKELDEVLSQIELLWFQKSCEDAIPDRDRNTQYYHLSTIIRRRFNHIESIQDTNGNWLWEKQVVQNMVRDFFMQLYSDDNGPYQSHILPHNRFPRMSNDQLAHLDKPYLGSEVKQAVFAMNPYKAPGPDGFQALFFQKYWDTTGPNLMELVLNVLKGSNFPDGFNETFLVLIPKVPNPQSMTQLRPIGLCNVAYKTISKMIVNRLKLVMETLVAPTQCSFVPGRQITDNIIIVQEMLHPMHRKSGETGYLAIKVDLEKAYDRLRWPHIRETLLEANLPPTHGTYNNELPKSCQV